MTPRYRPVRCGAALLEAIVALTVLGLTGLGMVTHVLQSIETARLSAIHDRETRSAAAEIQRMLLWTRADLTSHVGHSRTTCCDMDITLQSRNMFLITLSDTLTGSVVLETAIYAHTP